MNKEKTIERLCKLTGKVTREKIEEKLQKDKQQTELEKLFEGQ